MASVKKQKSGGYSVRIRWDGKELEMWGYTNRREAERFGQKLDELRACKKTGSLTPEMRVWADELAQTNTKVYDKLANAGLLPERQKKHTLAELVKEYLNAKKLEGLTEQTIVCFQKTMRNLTDFFGEDTLLESIDEAQAVAFKKWLLETPLNRRQKKPACYSPYNVERRLGSCKELFRFGVRLGWIQRNPLDVLKGSGFKQAPENRVQVEMDEFLRATENAPLKWKVIMYLGRMTGTRGQSELAYLRWEDVRWSETDEQGQTVPGSIALACTKNARHGRSKRVLPMCPALEAVLRDWYFQADEKEQKVFPTMTPKSNLGTMVEKVVRKALGYCWNEPWYSLRKSFVSDLMASGLDPVVYEYYTDHQLGVSMQHYQTMNASRLERGNSAFLAVWEPAETNTPENTPLTPPKTPLRGIPSGSLPLFESRQTLEKQYSGQQKSPERNRAQRGLMGRVGIEPTTPAFSGPCSTN